MIGVHRIYILIIQIKMHSSCEIEDFVETHLCKLCVMLRSRVVRVVSPHEGYIGRRLVLEVHSVARSGSTVMLVCLCAETIKLAFEGDKI